MVKSQHSHRHSLEFDTALPRTGEIVLSTRAQTWGPASVWRPRPAVRPDAGAPSPASLSDTRSPRFPMLQVAGLNRGDRTASCHHIYPPVAYFTLSQDGTVVEVNLAGAAMLGVPREFLTSRPFAHFVALSDALLFEEHRRQVVECRARHTCVITLVHDDGTHFLARLEGMSAHQNEGLGWVWRAAVTDLRVKARRDQILPDVRTPRGEGGVGSSAAFSARTTADGEPREKVSGARVPLGDLHAELLLASAHEKALETASMLVHELMQPLTAVINYVEACRRTLDNYEGQIPERALDCMDKAVREAGRAGQLVHRLRRLVEKGETNKEAVSINDTIKDAVATVLERARAEAVSVRLNLAPTLPPVLIDQIQIQQVIANLLRNGVEALIDQPERILTIGSAQLSDGAVEISVADTGPGLCPEVAARLFQPVVSRKAQGMGLGLSICRTIIDAHGGKIWATRGRPGGTVFHFTLSTAR